MRTRAPDPRASPLSTRRYRPRMASLRAVDHAPGHRSMRVCTRPLRNRKANILTEHHAHANSALRLVGQPPKQSLRRGLVLPTRSSQKSGRLARRCATEPAGRLQRCREQLLRSIRARASHRRDAGICRTMSPSRLRDAATFEIDVFSDLARESASQHRRLSTATGTSALSRPLTRTQPNCDSTALQPRGPCRNEDLPASLREKPGGRDADHSASNDRNIDRVRKIIAKADGALVLKLEQAQTSLRCAAR
jgi:hypothetical protein